MAIDTTAGLPARAAAAPPPVNPRSQLGNEAFLKLLVAELKQQDPTDPMDAREMISQLSQLSSVEKLSTIDKSLQDLKTQNVGLARAQVVSLVGRTVTADASTLLHTGIGQSQGSYELLGQASEVNVTVRDGGGRIVRTIDLGAQFPGPHGFAWDGADDAGGALPAGTYSYEIAAKDSRGLPVTTSTRITGIVQQVSYEGGAAELVVGESRVPLGDVISVAQ